MSDSMRHVEVLHRDGGVVEVSMNRPAKRNAMNKRLWAEIGHVFAEVREQCGFFMHVVCIARPLVACHCQWHAYSSAGCNCCITHSSPAMPPKQ